MIIEKFLLVFKVNIFYSETWFLSPLVILVTNDEKYELDYMQTKSQCLVQNLESLREIFLQCCLLYFVLVYMHSTFYD